MCVAQFKNIPKYGETETILYLEYTNPSLLLSDSVQLLSEEEESDNNFVVLININSIFSNKVGKQVKEQITVPSITITLFSLYKQHTNCIIYSGFVLLLNVTADHQKFIDDVI